MTSYLLIAAYTFVFYVIFQLNSDYDRRWRLRNMNDAPIAPASAPIGRPRIAIIAEVLFGALMCTFVYVGLLTGWMTSAIVVGGVMTGSIAAIAVLIGIKVIRSFLRRNALK